MTKKEAEADAKKVRKMIERVKKRNKRLGTTTFKNTKIVVKKAGYTRYGFKWAVHSIG